jgi:hypothetical protein
LEDRLSGCRLTFTHEIDDTCRPENLLPGWHGIFEDLPYVLDGEPRPSEPGRFRTHRDRYLQGNRPLTRPERDLGRGHAGVKPQTPL